MNRSILLLLLLPLLACEGVSAARGGELETVAPDLVTPAATDGRPAPGLRVKQFNDGYAGSAVYHLLYLPVDWVAGKRYPVIVEYAGNAYRTSPGTVEGCNLGYGISGGKGVIWICLPFVDKTNRANATRWWGDVEATVSYCKTTVRRVCAEEGGDPDAIFLAGFSRGSIACNYIGLHDDEIASLWRGFICHSHYDGVKEDWPYPGADRKSAIERLQRLRGRPQFISQERSTDDIAAYLKAACPSGDFTFQPMSFTEHTDAWVLRDVPERRAAREWLRKVLAAPKR